MYKFQNLNFPTKGVLYADFRLKASRWAINYNQTAYYSNNQIPYLHNGFENLLAVSNAAPDLKSENDPFSILTKLETQTEKFWCGLLSYDLKNHIEKLSSNYPEYIGYPLIHFFEPEIYLTFKPESVSVFSKNASPAEIIEQILAIKIEDRKPEKINWQSRTSKEAYLENVRKIQEEILEGNVYELNYTIEFFAENAAVSPVSLFEALNQKSPMPFAGFFKLKDTFLMCASPERFLKKEGNKLISQPIKGTIKRGKTPEEDEKLKQQLRHDEKEMAENMMIVDLTRNDLSRCAETGSVSVEELFGIYGFHNIFQMISTVTATLKPGLTLSEILKNTFPMGSMTGAPKISAMQLIEKYENHRRGLYSGSIGYLKPNGDFDFNVVIRSLQYNQKTGYLSYKTGSAITIDSIPEKEYEECLLKAEAILSID